MLSNLLKVIGEWREPIHSGPSICSFDLFFLIELAKYVGAENVVEFGCGITSAELDAHKIKRTTYSLEKNTYKGDLSFNECDLTDGNVKKDVIEALGKADLLIIDALHKWDFAKMYHEEFFPHYDGLIWIHDYWNPERIQVPYGEQRYLDAHAIDKTHRIFTRTDLSNMDVIQISSHIGYDVTPQKYPDGPYNMNRGPRMCALVLEKMQ